MLQGNLHILLCAMIDIENNQILPNPTIVISGTHIPLYVIHSAYPLKSSLIKDFPHNIATELNAQ